jgi:oxygen-independent coproporphyrinogen-3 oxidase
MARADVEQAVAAGVPHISAYQLTIEPNTVFFSRPPKLPPHDACADMQVMIEDLLNEKQFEHYETSAFARPGQRCRHNLNYWQFGDYLGIGAGAHGKISFPERVTRHEQAKQPEAYLKGAAPREAEVPARELPFEFMLNALRLVDGFPATLFQERTGLPLHLISSSLETAEGKGLLERDLKHIRPTAKGRRFLNDLLQEFLK